MIRRALLPATVIALMLLSVGVDPVVAHAQPAPPASDEPIEPPPVDAPMADVPPVEPEPNVRLTVDPPPVDQDRPEPTRLPAVPRRGDDPGRSSPVPAGGEELFVGDYETGDFTQWGTCQSVVLNSSCSEVDGSHYSMQLVDGPDAHQGSYAAHFVVKSGDNPGFAGGERSEVSAPDRADVSEGDERWYEWSMRVPEDFTNPEGWWFIVMQWHHNGSTGSPPLVINISNEGTIDIGGDGVDHPKRTIGPVRPGEWVDYVLHVKFSRDADTGFVEAWENGVQTVEKTHRATMVDDGNYLKQGIYRDEQDATHEVWLDGLRVTRPPAATAEPVPGLDLGLDPELRRGGR